MDALSGIGVAGALILMAMLIFKRISPMAAGPAAVCIVCLTSRISLMDALTDTYLHGVADFLCLIFLYFSWETYWEVFMR